jgi:hypothetical protein
LCSDTTLSVRTILKYYGYRWQAEVDNWHLKERFGLADYRLQSYEAILRWHALVFAAYAFVQYRRVVPLLTNPKAALPDLPEVIAAMEEQPGRSAFPMPGISPAKPRSSWRKKSSGFCPPGMSRVYFVSGGSEANEVALKLARQYHLERGEPSRVKIIGRWQGYHGATFAALAMGGHTHYRKDYLPYMMDFPHIHAPYCYRCRFDRDGCHDCRCGLGHRPV